MGNCCSRCCQRKSEEADNSPDNTTSDHERSSLIASAIRRGIIRPIRENNGDTSDPVIYREEQGSSPYKREQAS